MEIYLDHAATTPLAPEARAAMEPFLGAGFGNASSRHPRGVAAAAAIDQARRRIARAAGASPDGVVLTSGGTEANNLAVRGLALARRRAGRHVLIGPTEHPSVRAAALSLVAEGFEVEELRLDARGALDLEDLAARVRPDTALVSAMLVSNELGTLYPIAEVARIARATAPDVVVHADAVQAAGKVELSLRALGVDALSLSAHKVRGPQGAGALVLAERAPRPKPLFYGGGQERELRPGTENAAAIAGFGAALSIAARDVEPAARALGACRARLAEHLAALGARVLEPGRERSPAILAALLPGPPAEVWMHHLEARGVLCSAGSACNARKKGPSPALAALGLSADQALRVLRFSFGASTTPAEIDAAADALAAVARELRAPAR